MKEIAVQNGSLRKSLASSSAADASKSAARLEVIFKDIQSYWENRKSEDAITAAKNAVAASQAVSKALETADIGAANAATQNLGSTCAACHTAHRDRLAFDFYRIK
jgi:hypothetical protein